MMCQAKITGPDGKTAQARVFSDPGAACSFITERLALQFGILRQKGNSLIGGIAMSQFEADPLGCRFHGVSCEWKQQAHPCPKPICVTQSNH